MAVTHQNVVIHSNAIAKVLLKYGNRVQYSVFEVMLKSQDELNILL